MFVFDLFNKKVSEAERRPEPEQEIIDATRRARQQQEREPAGSEKIDAMLAQQHAQRQEYERTGNFWLKTKVEQRHIQGPFVGKAAANTAALELLKQAPELKGNLLITAYGPGEQQNENIDEGSLVAFEKDPFERWKKTVAMVNPNIGKNLTFVSKENGRKVVAMDRFSRIVYGEFNTQTMKGQVFDVTDGDLAEEKVRLDPSCWKNKKIGNPKTKMKGGVRVNNCVPAESVTEGFDNYLDNAIYDLGMSKPGMDQETFLDDLYSYLDAEYGKNVADRVFYREDENEYAEWYDKYQSLDEGVAEGLGKDLKRLATGKDVKSRSGQEIAKAQQASMTGDNKTAHKHFKRYDKLDKLANKEQGVAEGYPKHQDLSAIPTEKLMAFLEKHAGGGVPTFGQGAQVRRVYAELKRRQQGVAEGGYQDDSKESEENLRYARTRNPVADVIRKKLNPNQKPEKEQGVAEGLSKRDQQDVAAIRAAIARLEAQLNHPNADRDAILQSIAHEKKRLALYGQDVVEGSDPFTDGYNAWQQYLNGKTNRRPTNPYPAGHGMGQWEAGAAKAAEGHDFGQDDSRYDVAEDQINESPTIDFIRGLISEFNKQMSGSPYYPMDYKNPGMRMWTRGDGSKYKDPGYIFIDRDLKPEDIPKWQKAGAVEKFWKFLESKGARKIGDVSGEFGSDPHSPAIVLNKLIFVFNGRSIAWGSTSRLKNSNVWRQKQQGVAEAGVKQLPTQGADYSKYDTDHLKMMLRPGILHRNEARFKSLIRKELQKREQQSQQGVAEVSEQKYVVTIDAIDHGVLGAITVTASSPEEAKRKVVAGVKSSMLKRGYELMVRSVSVKPVEDVAEEDKSQVEKLRMQDYLDRADRLHDEIMTLQRSGNLEALKHLKQQYYELEAQARKGLVPEESVTEAGTPADQPRIRKYSKIRADGSKAERYEVLDYQGRRVAGQGSEGFDDLKNAKEFFRRNYSRLINPIDEEVLKTKEKKKERDDPAHPGKKMLESKKRYWCSTEKRWKEMEENKESN